mmetsp:Transcript_6781/g.6020  ORF Transcript_6781/g.6020 Transcript_6781/m.6020 type:complete len:80 (+) Transcript_6781:292-531(+)
MFFESRRGTDITQTLKETIRRRRLREKNKDMSQDLIKFNKSKNIETFQEKIRTSSNFSNPRQSTHVISRMAQKEDKLNS